MESLETKEQYLFLGRDMVGCADSGEEGKQDAEEMEKLMQGGRGTSLGGYSGRTGQKGSATATHRLDCVGFAGCSRSSDLGGVGSGRFVRFWREHGA